MIQNLRNGKLISEIYGPSKILDQIYAVNFESFDFETELKAAREIHAQALARGEAVRAPVIADGTEYEISYDVGETHFKMKAWNPGSDIDYFAPYSPKIAKLKKVLDILALYYGTYAFGI